MPVLAPLRRARRHVLRRIERSRAAFAALVLALGVVGAAGVGGMVVGPLAVQVVGMGVFAAAGGAALYLVESPAWLRLPVFLVFLLPSAGLAALVGPRVAGQFDGPTATAVGERVVGIPGGANCMGLYRYPAEGAVHTSLLAACAPRVPVEYVVGAPETARVLPRGRAVILPPEPEP